MDSAFRGTVSKKMWSRVMVFSSLGFVGVFLPIFLFTYYMVPSKMKNGVIFFGSLAFYTAGTIEHPEHILLLMLAIVVDYETGILMERYPGRKKLVLSAGIFYHVLWLFIFKYSGFVFSTDGLILPVGISFYTFQGISYIIDVYRRKFPAEKSLLHVAVYISMFPQLIAGPIVNYVEVRSRLRSRSKYETWENILKGMGIFVFGLGLKVLLANRIGSLWSDVMTIGFESISTPLAWMGIAAYSLQLYFDFFGYSVMAIGLGKMIGFELPVNFTHPYTSTSMTEFWRNWHITLGRWFREYIYIPLGGNRKGRLRTYFNMAVVWILTGIWHGAGYNFVLWGVFLFVVLCLEKTFLLKIFDKCRLAGHIYMLLLIPLSWSVFAIEDMEKLKVFLTRLFPFFGQGVFTEYGCDYVRFMDTYWILLLAGILFSTKLPYKVLGKIKNRFVIFIIVTMIFAGSVYCIYRGMNDPFMYFRF